MARLADLLGAVPNFYVAVGAKQIGTRESDSVPGRFLPLFELDLKESSPP